MPTRRRGLVLWAYMIPEVMISMASSRLLLFWPTNRWILFLCRRRHRKTSNPTLAIYGTIDDAQRVGIVLVYVTESGVSRFPAQVHVRFFNMPLRSPP
ncbi:hypothetical protein EDD18DRAFT_483932 [Armillaria luteobubalina]|uniref:Uncharacterized protein n=1 Tax=Armillaria luteobubalina TaxID=153913 RepID=A0AA39UUN6_9AGAR|nr:hypothetical protein EDD18DRAFT_483932 [Armillaria luteobubalina]